MAALISDAHAKCYSAFEDLIESVQHPVRDFKDDLPWEEIQEEFDKYKIWAGNVCAGHSAKRYEISLDYRLQEASFLKHQVLNLLAVLDQRIANAASLIRGERKPFEEHVDESEEERSSSSAPEADDEEEHPSDSPWDISSDSSGNCAASKKAKLLRDDDKGSSNMTRMLETAATSNLPSDLITSLGRTPTLEMPRLLESIKFTINCLYRIPIRKPAPFDRLSNETSLESSCYQHFDLLYIRDKFPRLNLDVATRLGTMITRRRQMLQRRKAQAKSLDTSRAPPESSLLTESTSKALTMNASADSQVTRSYSKLRSKATLVRPEEVLTRVARDNINPMALYPSSVAESKSSMASSFAGKELQVGIPPRPKGDGEKEPDYFEYPNFLSTKNITTDDEWKSV